jgi:hypothetical protein
VRRIGYGEPRPAAQLKQYKGVKMRKNGVIGGIASLAILGLLSCMPQIALASLQYTYSGSGFDTTVPLAAEVTFQDVGSNLQITLTNLSTDPMNSPPSSQSDALMAVYFNGIGAPTGGSGALGAGSTFFDGTTGSTTGSVNSYWGYSSSASGNWTYQPTAGSLTLHQGVSASGLTNFGQSFDGTNLDGSAGGLVGPDATPVLSDGLGSRIYIKNSVVITLYNDQFDPNTTEVLFQYGTSDSEPQIIGTPVGPPTVGSGGVPEPASLAVWGIVSALAAGSVALKKQKLSGRWSQANRAAIYQVIGAKAKK